MKQQSPSGDDGTRANGGSPHCSEAFARLAGKLDRIGYRVNKATEMLCATLAASMVFIVGFGVIERYLLHSGQTWPEELARYVMIWMALLAVPMCAHRREHIGLDIVFSRLPLGFQPYLRIVLDLIGIAFFTLLLVYGIGMCEAGTTQYATIFGITMLIPFMSVPVSSALTVFQLVVTLIRERAGITPQFVIAGEGGAVCSQ